MNDSFILTFMRSMMGVLTPVWDYVMAHSEQAFSLLGVWFGIYLIARYQVKLIKQKTAALCVEETKKILKKTSQSHLKRSLQRNLPRMGRKSLQICLFHPPPPRLFPSTPSHPANVLQKFEFNSEWLAEVLKLNGVKLSEFTKK